MDTVSLRRFRDHIGEWTEPVRVQRRLITGAVEVIGEWHPIGGGVPTNERDRLAFNDFVSSHPEAVAIVNATRAKIGREPIVARPFTPVPKPIRRK